MNLTRQDTLAGARIGVSWGLLLLVVVTGCSGRQSAVYGDPRTLLANTDDFGMLLLNAGLRADSLLAEDRLTPEEARRLWLLLSFDSTDGGMQRTGPRTAATYLLAEVALGGQPVSRETLNARLLRFAPLAVLRPDGCLVMVLTGIPVQCAGPVQVQDGTLRAGEFVVGNFYSSQEGGFREDRSVPTLPNSTFHHGVVVTVEPK
ncbi:hypothetical protein [Pyxidicoccus xibeiensis]|uniref:hypothetical protein n=1 Tax=Pyxidicoccus xibeiensis TaxID=2906759 RepID=UPI0020A71510|nr:hypothetical protein [Pyxidicoccus xibeiensis]MCP3136785.1 hypothetical protein [Pyxidicoccus xibeiensis]